MKRKYIITLAVSFSILLCLAFFCIPRHIQFSSKVFDLSGNAMQFDIDIKVYRRLFNAPYVKGSVYLDGVEYKDEDYLFNKYLSQNKAQSNQTATDRSFPENMVFCKEPELNEVGDRIAAFEIITQNRINFVHLGNGNLFDKFGFVFMDQSMVVDNGISGIYYYGPARTLDEALEIATALGDVN